MAIAMLVRRISVSAPASEHLASLKLPNFSYRSSVPINTTNTVHFRALSVHDTLADHHKSTRRLVLYSKPGCCLCDNLKEKLEAVFIIGGEQSLSDVQLEMLPIVVAFDLIKNVRRIKLETQELQVRDITTKPEWEAAYQYEIPVLARINEDESETVIPRFSPRISIELIHKKLAAALT